MIDVLFEQRVVQNTGLAAETIWHAVNQAHEQSGRLEGVSFPLAFVVVPLTFHRRTATVLASKAQPGALYKALSEDREILVGLQERMEALADRTLAALSIAFQSGLLLLDQDPSRQLYPGRKSPPVTHVTSDVQAILSAAKRVGQGLGEMSAVQLSTTLGIRF